MVARKGGVFLGADLRLLGPDHTAYLQDDFNNGQCFFVFCLFYLFLIMFFLFINFFFIMFFKILFFVIFIYFYVIYYLSSYFYLFIYYSYFYIYYTQLLSHVFIFESKTKVLVLLIKLK